MSKENATIGEMLSLLLTEEQLKDLKESMTADMRVAILPVIKKSYNDGIESVIKMAGDIKEKAITIEALVELLKHLKHKDV